MCACTAPSRVLEGATAGQHRPDPGPVHRLAAASPAFRTHVIIYDRDPALGGAWAALRARYRARDAKVNIVRRTRCATTRSAGYEVSPRLPSPRSAIDNVLTIEPYCIITINNVSRRDARRRHTCTVRHPHRRAASSTIVGARRGARPGDAGRPAGGRPMNQSGDHGASSRRSAAVLRGPMADSTLAGPVAPSVTRSRARIAPCSPNLNRTYSGPAAPAAIDASPSFCDHGQSEGMWRC